VFARIARSKTLRTQLAKNVTSPAFFQSKLPVCQLLLLIEQGVRNVPRMIDLSLKTRGAKKKTKSQSNAIRVFARVRPLNTRERELKDSIIVKVAEDDPKCMTLLVEQANAFSEEKTQTLKRFLFDAAFAADCTQADVYAQCSDYLAMILRGEKTCLMSYGQVGSGKSYSVMGYGSATSGDMQYAGIAKHLIDGIARAAVEQKSATKITFTLSMCEIIENKLRDLLWQKPKQQQQRKKKSVNAAGNTPPVLRIFHDKKQGVVIQNLVAVRAHDTSSAFKIMESGSRRRTIASTAMNATSSRGHLVVRVNVTITDKKSNRKRHGALLIVDLAGAQRTNRSKVTGQRLKESAAINDSLSCLGRVMRVVAQNSSQQGARRKPLPVPFRSCVLTEVLADVLGGDSRTHATLIAHVSPAASNLDSTLSTFRFATSAKGMRAAGDDNTTSSNNNDTNDESKET
jgi:kinesin family protein C2/C3